MAVKDSSSQPWAVPVIIALISAVSTIIVAWLNRPQPIPDPDTTSSNPPNSVSTTSPAQHPIITSRILIKSTSGNYYLDHQIDGRKILLADQPYDPETGAYNGTLWEIIDAGGGRILIKSTSGNYYLDHQIDGRRILLADQPYDPETGAYNGTLWQILER